MPRAHPASRSQRAATATIPAAPLHHDFFRCDGMPPATSDRSAWPPCRRPSRRGLRWRPSALSLLRSGRGRRLVHHDQLRSGGFRLHLGVDGDDVVVRLFHEFFALGDPFLGFGFFRLEFGDFLFELRSRSSSRFISQAMRASAAILTTLAQYCWRRRRQSDSAFLTSASGFRASCAGRRRRRPMTSVRGQNCREKVVLTST